MSTINTPHVLNTGRIQYIDLAKGFCICLVVFHHYCYQYTNMDSFVNHALISFRMPLYFILSGFFFKDYGSLLNFTKRKTNKILIPFIFWGWINAILVLVVKLLKGELMTLRPLESIYQEQIPNYPVWFLWGLFLTGIIFYLIHLISTYFHKYQPIVILSVSLLVGIIGFNLGNKGINLPCYLDTALTVTPFYAFGYLLKKYTSILYPNKIDKYLILIAIACFAYVLIFADKVSFIENNMKHANAFIMYSCGVVGSLGILAVAKRINSLPIFSYLGRYSIIILCTHTLFYQFVFHYIIQYFQNNTDIPLLYISIACFVIMCLLYLLIIPLIKKFLPYFCAQKDVIKV